MDVAEVSAISAEVGTGVRESGWLSLSSPSPSPNFVGSAGFVMGAPGCLGCSLRGDQSPGHRGQLAELRVLSLQGQGSWRPRVSIPGYFPTTRPEPHASDPQTSLDDETADCLSSPCNSMTWTK